MNAKNVIRWAWKIILALVLIFLIVMYPSFRFFFKQDRTEIDEKLSIISGGGNSAILETDSAVVVVDTKMGRMAKNLYEEAVRRANGKPIVVINTHFHGDHTAGNNLYSGSRKIIGHYEPAFLEKEIKTENLPNEFVQDSLILSFGDEKVKLYALGQAHTMNDMVVLLEKRNILITGDLAFHQTNPAIHKKYGAHTGKWTALLEEIYKRWPQAFIIPGHGNPGSSEIILSMMEYFKDMKEAALNPSKEKEMKRKYKDWVLLPGMMSPSITIKAIRNETSNV